MILNCDEAVSLKHVQHLGHGFGKSLVLGTELEPTSWLHCCADQGAYPVQQGEERREVRYLSRGVAFGVTDLRAERRTRSERFREICLRDSATGHISPAEILDFLLLLKRLWSGVCAPLLLISGQILGAVLFTAHPLGKLCMEHISGLIHKLNVLGCLLTLLEGTIHWVFKTLKWVNFVILTQITLERERVIVRHSEVGLTKVRESFQPKVIGRGP
jgi:hypothetical protein